MLKGLLSKLIRRSAAPHKGAFGAAARPDRPSFAERLSDPSLQGSDELAGQLRARQVNAIQRLAIPLMIVNLVNIAALILELWLTGQLGSIAIAWSATTAVIAAAILAKAVQRRNRAVPRATSAATVRRVVRSALLFGLLWSVPGLGIVPQLSGMALAFATALLTGMIAGGAIVLYPVPAAAVAFILPVAASGVAGLVLSNGWLAVGPAVLAAAFLYIFLGVMRRHADLFVSEFVARLELEQRNRLIEDLLEDARLEVLGARRLGVGQRIDDAVGEVAGGMAHHFNNLLTVLRGNAELLAEEGDADRTLVAPILEGCDRGALAVRRLLAASGRQILHPEPVALDELVLHLQQAFQASLGPRIQVVARVEEDGCIAMADREKLEAALIELMENARDAIAGPGEIVITCRTARGPQDLVAVGIRDTGIGMDEALRRTATDPFFTTRTAEAATGLGLSAARGFARQSGGDLRIESWPGTGTSVTLVLPSAAAAAGQPRGRPVRDGTTVLLVESDPELRATTEPLLRDLGYRVTAAADAEDALRVLTDGQAVDLLLTNLLLQGGVSGVELSRRVQESRPATRTLFLSQLPGARPAARRSASDGAVLSYPFTRAELARHLKRTLSDRNAVA